ncbi:hypothetical protein GCM10027038_35580 [Arthrobacter bambusae]
MDVAARVIGSMTAGLRVRKAKAAGPANNRMKASGSKGRRAAWWLAEKTVPKTWIRATAITMKLVGGPWKRRCMLRA